MKMDSTAHTATRVVASPIGDLRVGVSGAHVTRIEFSPFDPMPESGETQVAAADERVLDAAQQQLAEYFAGQRSDFDLPLAPAGTTFQHQVWDQLVLLGHGETATYAQIAHRLGRTNAASRAVGLANGRNPIPVVIPCHRVIGADGTLTGYAGGLERKRILLDLERGSGPVEGALF